MPGPGNYEEKSHVGEGPQYSMYQKRDTKIAFTPGPGDYENPNQEQKGVTIGQRFEDKQAEEIPGPGNYQAKSHIAEGPQYSIYQKRDNKIEQTPGPGDYNNPEKEQKGVTIGRRITEREGDDLPGPGNYQDKTHIGEGAKYSIYQKREQKIEQTPGPGEYEELSEAKKGVVIGKRIQEREAEELPGPGNYEGNTYVGEGPQYSMYPKREHKIDFTPGPGDYEQVSQKQKGVIIGQRLKDKYVEELPGPGNYEGKTHIGEGAQYSIYQKREQKIEQTPGPGDYNNPNQEQKGVTIGKRFENKPAEDIPGPGNYQAKSHIKEGPQYSIYQKREQKINFTPGPGDYESVKDEQKGIIIGQRLKERDAEELPGPGNYEGRSHLGEGPHYTMYEKRDQKIEQTPGPGDYNDPNKEQKGVTIGQRFTSKQAEDIPGPGNYQNKSHVGEGPQYSMNQKREQKIKFTPGPGDYEQVKKEQKGVIIGQRLKEKHVDEIPGPGNYDGKNLRGEGPNYSIYQRREHKIEQTPGPGDYNDPNKEQKGVTIGQRFLGKQAEDIPGPGNYQDKSHVGEGPQYSMYHKREQKIE